MAVDVCYIASHGFASRMLLQTNLVQKLVDRGLSVAIVSHDSSDENLASLSGNPQVTLVDWKERNSIWDDDYLYKRMYFLEDINANPALREKFHNALFYSKSKHPWKRIRPLWYYLIFQLIKLFPGIRKRFLKREHRYLNSVEADRILADIKPKLLVSTYPVAILDAKMLHAARQADIKTVLHLLSWDNISCKGKFPVLADSYLAWGPIMQEELKEYYNVDHSRITLCGVPHFDAHIEAQNTEATQAAIAELGLDATKPYLFVAMSSPRFAPREIDIVEWLAQAVESNRLGERLQLVVRPHPQNVKDFTARQSWLGRLDKLASNRVAIDYPELAESKIRWSMKHNDMLRLAHLLAGCSVCINSGSTVSIDALMHNKPVVLTSFDADAQLPYWNSARRLVDYNHLKKFVAEGGAEVARSFADLESVLAQFLKDANHGFDKRQRALQRECFAADGHSTNRVVEALIQQLKPIAV